MVHRLRVVFAVVSIVLVSLLLWSNVTQAAEVTFLRVLCDSTRVRGKTEVRAPFVRITVNLASDLTVMLAEKVVPVFRFPGARFSAQLEYKLQAPNTRLIISVGEWDGKRYLKPAALFGRDCMDSGVPPTPTPLPTISATPVSETPPPTPVPSISPTFTPSPTVPPVSPTFTPSFVPTGSHTPSPTPLPSRTPPPVSHTPSPTPPPSSSPTITRTPPPISRTPTPPPVSRTPTSPPFTPSSTPTLLPTPTFPPATPTTYVISETWQVSAVLQEDTCGVGEPSQTFPATLVLSDGTVLSLSALELTFPLMNFGNGAYFGQLTVGEVSYTLNMQFTSSDNFIAWFSFTMASIPGCLTSYFWQGVSTG